MAISAGTSKWKSFLKSEPKPGKAVQAREREKSQSGSSTPTKRSSQQPSWFSEKYRRTNTVLGQSAAGSVFVAIRRRDERCVAVKRFARSLNSDRDESHARKIVAEFWVGSQLEHENVAQSLDLLREQDGSWFQVMEYVPLNLFDRVCSKKMSREEIDCAFLQIVAGTAYLHQSGVAHRDLKLENVVFSVSGVMKLIDFGVAAVSKKDDLPVALLHDPVGTRPYMAPELIRHKPYNPRSTDVWSLAILYCCMVMQRFPWKEAATTDRDFAAFIEASTISNSMGRKNVPHHTIASTPESESLHRVISTEKTASICIIIEEVSGRDSTEIETVNSRPWKPSQTFSADAWNVLRGMLQIDDQKRSTMKQIKNSTWIQETRTCTDQRGSDERLSRTHSHV